MRRIGRMTLVALSLLAGTALEGWAQSLGTFRFQLQPYCNVVVVNITQDGSVYTVDGYDDQCGATQRASVVGMALLNPDGTVGLGMTIVAAPGGTPTQVYATASPVTGNGSWRDGAGASGSFILTPGASTGGSLRPLPPSGLPDGSVTSAKILDGTVSASDINPAQVQQRVAGACAAGELMTGVNQDGTVACQAVTSGSGGDITGVTAGTGLAGGGQTGAVTLSVAFGGPGGATTVARSDHTHNPGGTAHTRVGENALPTTGGSANTAVGSAALGSNTSGGGNTAVGASALLANTTGVGNTAVGSNALRFNGANQDNTAMGYRAALQGGERNTVIGSGALELGNSAGNLDNTAIGHEALRVAEGGDNTAIGATALRNLGTGLRNIALGNAAGVNLTSGNDNIYIGNSGVVSDDGVIRIGRVQTTRAFLQGVRGVTTGVNNALTVVIDSTGQLGTVSSSRKTKFDIADLNVNVASALQRLRPVQFRYLKPFADGSTPIQYGLIAEEVQDVLPELVALDDDGQPASVKYHILPSLLLAEVQRLSRELAALQSEFAALAAARR